MRLLVTGLNGTLAPRLAAAARAAGHEVRGWDRRQVPADGGPAGGAWLAAQRVDAVAHLALGGEAWAAQLAAFAAARGLPLLYTSTAMVFHHAPDGPHAPADPRTAQDDYGRAKARGEDAVLGVHPQAVVARIGWQIDARQPGNNMLMQLDAQQRRDGCVAASCAWTPACSFIDDTVAALLTLLQAPRPGIVHLDSNAAEAHRFDAVVAALRRRFARDAWVLRVHDDYRHDQRLVGGPLALPPLSTRLDF